MTDEPRSVDGLSILILHYNRPWCLEIASSLLHRQLEREGLRHQMILADDGSDRSVWPLFDKLPFDDVVIQQARGAGAHPATVYDTLQRAYSLIRCPYVLFLQDDFWLVPQGFVDVDKSHLAGLQPAPDFDRSVALFTGTVELLAQRADSRMVELARSFSNPRYHCESATECAFAGLRFRAKQQARHPRFYSCDWPHVMRADDMRAVPLPVGEEIWHGERVLVERRRAAFGEGNWIYNPALSFFAHVNVFTWRALYKDGVADRALRWEGASIDSDLPFGRANDTETNAMLLQAYVAGRLTGATEMYARLGPFGYLSHLWSRVTS